MTCSRCQGFMVGHRFVDLESSGNDSFVGWRCTNCGNVEDAQMLQNRARQPSPDSPSRHAAKKTFPLAL